jgi:hypothetical protein
MEEFSITISGVEETCAALRDAPRAALPGALERGGAAAGDVIAECITGQMEFGGMDKTGELLADLGTTVTLVDDGEGVHVSTGFSNKQAYIARWDEYGHSEIGHEPRKKFEGTEPPHPFMRPAGEQAIEPAVEAFDSAVMADLDAAGVFD